MASDDASKIDAYNNCTSYTKDEFIKRYLNTFKNPLKV